MERYDPLQPPDANEWLALPELARLDLIVEYHEHCGEEFPSIETHGTFHAIVENQIALGELSVQHTLSRLLKEGLDRHNAIHAIASVVCANIFDMWKKRTEFSPESYKHGLEKLTAEKWLNAS